MNREQPPLVRRSALFVPANRRRFVEKAWTVGADAVIIDLEDAVAPGDKIAARAEIAWDIETVALGGADVLIRVNNDPELLDGDLEASVLPGVWGLGIPKLETPEEVLVIEDKISRLEYGRGIAPGSIRLMGFIESASGFLRAQEILSAGSRISAAVFGTEDFTKEINMRYADGGMLHYPKLHLLLVAKALGLYCPGMMGKNTDFHDLAAFEKLAREAFRYGFNGTNCIHPSQVEIANRSYMPGEDEIAEAREIIAVFEQAVREGKGSVKLNDRMIDKPIVIRAEETLDVMRRIEEKEARKLARLLAAKERLGLAQ